jgi:hypothetical protein
VRNVTKDALVAALGLLGKEELEQALSVFVKE